MILKRCYIKCARKKRLSQPTDWQYNASLVEGGHGLRLKGQASLPESPSAHSSQTPKTRRSTQLDAGFWLRRLVFWLMLASVTGAIIAVIRSAPFLTNHRAPTTQATPPADAPPTETTSPGAHRIAVLMPDMNRQVAVLVVDEDRNVIQVYLSHLPEAGNRQLVLWDIASNGEARYLSAISNGSEISLGPEGLRDDARLVVTLEPQVDPEAVAPRGPILVSGDLIATPH